MEFHVAASVRGEAGVLSLIGRCGKEPIRPGAEFRTLFRTRRGCLERVEAPPEVQHCRELRLKVQSIEAYGRSVDFLPPNTTGVLQCVDSTEELIPGGWVLTDDEVAVTAH